MYTLVHVLVQIKGKDMLYCLKYCHEGSVYTYVVLSSFYGTSGSRIINIFHAVVPLSFAFLNESLFYMYACSRGEQNS